MSLPRKVNVQKELMAQAPQILSHATIATGSIIYLSGQIPMDETRQIVPGGIKEHAAQCLKNIGLVLDAAGSSWEKVLKINIYLKDMNDFAAMNEVYESVVPHPRPARTCIQAAKLPRDADIEMEAVAQT